jgi:hypothetical protein
MDETGMAAAMIHGQQAAYTRATTVIGCQVAFPNNIEILNSKNLTEISPRTFFLPRR